jgi:hypothetical protein
MTIGLKMQKMDVSNLLFVHGFDFDVFFKEFLKKSIFQKSAWCCYVSITVFSIKGAQEERNFKLFTVLFIFHPKDSNLNCIIIPPAAKL